MKNLEFNSVLIGNRYPKVPEIFTVTSQEYESVHAAWCKAIKVLPDYSIVHKQ